MAQVAGDDDSLHELIGNHMTVVDRAFPDGESYMGEAIALKALIRVLARYGGERLDLSRPVKVESELLAVVRADHQVAMSPRRAAQLLRQAGFTTRVSGGVTIVDVTLPLLARACLKLQIDDDLVKAEIARTG